MLYKIFACRCSMRSVQMSANVEHACRCSMRMFASLPANVAHACRCSMRSVAVCIRGKVTLARSVHSWASDPCPCTRATPSLHSWASDPCPQLRPEVVVLPPMHINHIHRC